jgi:hypothetical protein
MIKWIDANHCVQQWCRPITVCPQATSWNWPVNFRSSYVPRHRVEVEPWICSMCFSIPPLVIQEGRMGPVCCLRGCWERIFTLAVSPSRIQNHAELVIVISLLLRQLAFLRATRIIIIVCTVVNKNVTNDCVWIIIF